jgi:hypothetical protein
MLERHFFSWHMGAKKGVTNSLITSMNHEAIQRSVIFLPNLQLIASMNHDAILGSSI